MLVHPEFDPIALQVGPLAIRWYGLMYLTAFAQFLFLARWQLRHRTFDPPWDAKDVEDLLFYGVLGVIVGGRLGEVLLYRPTYFLHNPFEVLAVWKGGMSFHGGLIGVIVAIAWFARSRKRTFFSVSDFVAPLVPLGYAFGRLGNFVNAELVGRPTNVPWAMVFPSVDRVPRHPSQLYHAALEGLLLFVILWIFASKPRQTGRISALFLVGYGVLRSFVEFFRTPDFVVGLGKFDLTSGQLYCVPMIAVGLFLWWQAGLRDAASNRSEAARDLT